jgi:hypothetical protein
MIRANTVFTEDDGRVYKSAEPMPWGMILVGRVFPRIEDIPLPPPRRRQFESYSFKPTVNVIV